MAEAAHGGFFDAITKGGVNVTVVSGERPKLPFHSFFPDNTPDANEANVYLNTRGWTITGEHFDEANKVVSYDPDTVPEGLEYAPIGYQRIDGEILHKYVIFNPESAEIKVIRGGKDIKDGPYSKEIDAVALEDQGFEQLYSDLGLQVYAKTKMHSVEIPSELLENDTLRSIVDSEMNYPAVKKK